MKSTVKLLLQRVLNYPDHQQEAYQQALTEIINYRNLKKIDLEATKPGASIIIFSKDRAIQLHALLASYFDLVSGIAPVTILFTCSTHSHLRAYKEVEQIFSDKPVTFCKESDFRHDLLRILNTVNTGRVLFLVDDIIFTERFNLEHFAAFDTDTFVPSLRMGGNLNFAYTVQKNQPLPLFHQELSAANDKLVWCWENGVFDWNYPLSVDGHVFDTKEMTILIKYSQFKAPNSLEQSLQIYNPIYCKRFGVAFKKSVIVNIPNNKVQTENDNIAGSTPIDFLLEKWQNGYQINFPKLKHFVNESAHQEVDIEFTLRVNS